MQRWEGGARAPDPGAEAAIVAYCRHAGLLRAFDRGPLTGLTLTESGLQDLFAEARWRGARARSGGATGRGASAPPAPPAPERSSAATRGRPARRVRPPRGRRKGR